VSKAASQARSSSDPLEPGGEEMHKTQADPEAAERFITEKRLGERIRRLRLKKSMGLVELGRHTGLSASFLSQLETGRVVPTLRNLARIAMVFSKDLSYFFESEPAAIFRVHRRKDRVRMPQTGVEPPTYTFESLGYMVPDRSMDPYFAEFIPLRPPARIPPTTSRAAQRSLVAPVSRPAVVWVSRPTHCSKRRGHRQHCASGDSSISPRSGRKTLAPRRKPGEKMNSRASSARLSGRKNRQNAVSKLSGPAHSTIHSRNRNLLLAPEYWPKALDTAARRERG